MREHFLVSLLDFLTVCFLFWKFPLFTKCLKFSKSFKILFWKLFSPMGNKFSFQLCKIKLIIFYGTWPLWTEAKPKNLFPSIFWLVLGILAPSTSILAPNIAKRMVFTREFPAMLISRDCMLSYHWFHLSNYCDVIFWVFSKFAIFNYFLILFTFFRFQFP